MASLDSLDALLEEELKDIYDAEKQLTKALPKMIKKASSPELKAAFEAHLQETEQHVLRLEEAFDHLEMAAKGKKCEGMKHLIQEGEEMIGQAADDDARDAILIAAAQKVEHYEIASYGTMRTWANLLGRSDVAALLEDTLEEEKEADQKLTGIAEKSVNLAAADEEEEDEDRTPARGRAAGPARSGAAVRSAAAADRGRLAAKGRAGNGKSKTR